LFLRRQAAGPCEISSCDGGPFKRIARFRKPHAALFPRERVKNTRLSPVA